MKELGIDPGEEKLSQIVEARLREEIKRGVQTIQYQVVTLMTTNGQAPFITVFMYLNEAGENQRLKSDLAIIVEEMLRQRYQGVKNEKGVWITPAFPKLIYVLEDDNIREGTPYFYLTKLAAKCTAKRMVPDYISEKKMKEYKLSKGETEGNGDVFTCMGCRSFLTPDRSGTGWNNVANAHAMAPMHPITSSLNNFLTLAIYWIGAGLIAAAGSTGDKMVLFSDMIVFSSYAMQVVSAFMLMIGIIRGLPRAMVAAGRVEEVIEAEPSIKDGGFDGVTDAEGEVEFRDVGFSYPDTEGPAIEKVSFKVGKGQTLAIIGPTGSGKSTLVNLIPRFYDATGGQVLVDGIDVREYDQKALRRRIGYVPQSAVIFSGSVEYNVNYGDTSADRTEDDVRKALEIAQGIDFVEKMEGGMDGHVSQYGRNVSGGQKQRICIARAVCKRPEILIFDDTFSALDFKTDLALRESLKRETAGTTNIIVAQRIGTIMDADRIIVLDKGKVVGDGTHDRLMKECGIYRNIAMSQMTGEGPE